MGTSENYYADPSASQMGLGDVALSPREISAERQ